MVGLLGDGTNSHHIIAYTVCPLYLWTLHLQILLIHLQILHPWVRRANHIHCHCFGIKGLSTRGFWCELGLRVKPLLLWVGGLIATNKRERSGEKRDNIWQHYKVGKDVFSSDINHLFLQIAVLSLPHLGGSWVHSVTCTSSQRKEQSHF